MCIRDSARPAYSNPTWSWQFMPIVDQTVGRWYWSVNVTTVWDVHVLSLIHKMCIRDRITTFCLAPEPKAKEILLGIQQFTPLPALRYRDGALFAP